MGPKKKGVSRYKIKQNKYTLQMDEKWTKATYKNLKVNTVGKQKRKTFQTTYITSRMFYSHSVDLAELSYRASYAPIILTYKPTGYPYL